MVAIQVRDISETTRAELAAEAERRGESLQAFLHDVLEREAASASNRALVARARARATGTRTGPTDTRELIRAGWDERMRAIYEAIGEPGLPTR